MIRRVVVVGCVAVVCSSLACDSRKHLRRHEPITEQATTSVELRRLETGVSDDTIDLGTTGSYTGPSAAQGIETYRGAQAYFLEVNATGGVHDRKIRLNALDDNYDKARALENAKKLIEENCVFALFDGNGTEMIKNYIPVLSAHKAEGLFAFGNTTGADSHREGEGFDVWYNVRASYRQEAARLVDALVDAGFKRVGVFYQDDGFGRAGLDGASKALERRGLKLAASASQAPKQTFEASTIPQASALKQACDAILVFTLYQPAAAFVRDARDSGFNGPIANSSIANDTFLRLLAAHEKQVRATNPGKSYFDKPLLNAQTFPNWQDETIPVVREFRTLMDKRNPQAPNEIRDPNYRTLPYQSISLEGFVNAKIFVEVLRRVGPNLTRARFREIIEQMNDYDPGLGVKVTFGPRDHQALDTVWLTGIEDDKWVTLDDPTPYLRGQRGKRAGASVASAKQ